MIVEVDGGAFHAALQLAGRIETNTSLPMLRNVLLETRSGKLHLQTTDLERQWVVQADADVAQDGAVCVPLKLLQEVVAKLGKGPVSLERDAANALWLYQGKLKLRLAGLPPDDFVAIQAPEKEVYCDLPSATLQRLLKLALHATDQDRESVRAYRHVLVELNPDGKLLFAGMDGHRAGVGEVQLDAFDYLCPEPRRVLLPHNGVASLLAALPPNLAVRLFLGKNQGTVEWAGVQYGTRLLDQTYTDVRRLTERYGTWSRELVVDRRALLASLARVMVTAKRNEEHGAEVFLSLMSDRALRLFARSTAGEVEDEVEIVGRGEVLHWKGSGDYLRASLDAVPDEQLRLKLHETNGPLRIGGEREFALVMSREWNGSDPVETERAEE